MVFLPLLPKWTILYLCTLVGVIARVISNRYAVLAMLLRVLKRIRDGGEGGANLCEGQELDTSHTPIQIINSGFHTGFHLWQMKKNVNIVASY